MFPADGAALLPRCGSYPSLCSCISKPSWISSAYRRFSDRPSSRASRLARSRSGFRESQQKCWCRFMDGTPYNSAGQALQQGLRRHGLRQENAVHPLREVRVLWVTTVQGAAATAIWITKLSPSSRRLGRQR